MTPAADLLDRLAHAVAEGKTVDWSEALSSATDLSERTAIEQLRKFDSIAHGVDTATADFELSKDRERAEGVIVPGQLLGQRYRIQSCLGRGGMGEVWHAYDLKLGVDVALKRMNVEQLGGAKALELLHREVRSARAVLSPNVCRIYDLAEVEGQELVSMEYVDGTTLRDVLRSRGPLDLREVMEVASQFLAGLAAIHEAGLIHRDLKPENVMLTRAGRVILMDFGLAKPQTEDRTATIAGTPAYMAPEQVRGGHLGARTDIFAAGVVLAELTHADRISDRDSREQLYRGVHEDPPRLPDSRWRPVLLRALSKATIDRYPSARALQRALEQVTLQVEGADQLKPYPGLASFTEKDAEYFFGRELEVEAVWKKLHGRNLLGVIGPSGAGKSSFLRAGLLPAIPDGWGAVVCHPGDAPLAALVQALVDEFAGDTDALRRSVASHDPETVVEAFERWRKRHDETLLIVDQFEELFTLNREEEQSRIAEVLGRLVMELDVHVLISMRDDFLVRCHSHPALQPMYSDLTVLEPPTGAALHRAVVQPALLCGYRFEDETFVEEIVDEVSRERGALPLLAFALAQLWEHRDRDRGLITREAYGRIGGVSGALAQHAEATIERIGGERIPIVRELFRNLVTAQGTRVSRDVEDLLSVFDQQEPAEQVLRRLVDARLLTSYEYTTGKGEDEKQHQRVEVIHESLLTSWPRLVRWRTQDEDSAQLRDQLRQAASMWQERGRSADLLWTGTAYQEFEVWRTRYPGGLTTAEESYAGAMREKAVRSRRRRRITLTAAFALLLVVLGMVSWSGLEQRSARLRAEANNLLTLGRTHLETYPTAGLAYAIASLEKADSAEARRFALEVLWRGPTAFSEDSSSPTPTSGVSSLDFSPDGRWLHKGRVLSHKDGSQMVTLPAEHGWIGFSGNSRYYFTGIQAEQRRFTITVHSLPDGIPVNSFEPEFTGPALFDTSTGEAEIWFLMSDAWDPSADEAILKRWQLETRTEEELSRIPVGPGTVPGDFDGELLVYGANRAADGQPVLLENRDPNREVWAEFYVLPVGESQAVVPRLFATAKGRGVVHVNNHPDQTQAVAAVADYSSGEAAVEFWSFTGDSSKPIRTFPVAEDALLDSVGLDPQGRWMIGRPSFGAAAKHFHVWDLSAPPGADPLILRRGATSWASFPSLHPAGTWVAITDSERTVSLWPLGRTYAHILRGHEHSQVLDVLFDPQGQWVASTAHDGTVRLWPLSDADARQPRILLALQGLPARASVSSDGESMAVFTRFSSDSPLDSFLLVIPIKGGDPRKLEASRLLEPTSIDFDPGGGRIVVAAVPVRKSLEPEASRALIHVWDLESGRSRTLESENGQDVLVVEFMDDGRLLALEENGVVRLWDLEADQSKVLVDDSGVVAPPGGREESLRPWGASSRLLSPDGRYLLIARRDAATSAVRPWVYDLERGSWLPHVAQRLCSLGGTDPSTATTEAEHLLPGSGCTTWPVWHPSGEYLITGSQDGSVRVVPLDGGEPHLLLAHDGVVSALAVYPDGEWIASTGHDGTLRLWPMPKGRPLQALPYEELLTKLRSLTNYRVVQEEGAASGYRVTYDKLPSWDEVPTW